MPFPFYLSCVALVGLGVWAWSQRRRAWGLPACMVLGTVAVWYIGDVLYNEFGDYLETIGSDSLTSAWWQVLWFLLVFGSLVVPVHRLVNQKHLRKKSRVVLYLDTSRLRRPDIQARIDKITGVLFGAWVVLMLIALFQVRGNALGLFAPYLGEKVNPWARGQIGGGSSALISFAAYVQIFLTAAFGVIAAVSMNRKTRALALFVCFLAFPVYVFDRTRNTMLAAVLPGFLAFVFFRLRGGLPKKLSVLAVGFLCVNFWFSVVMANRSGMSFDIDSALSGSGAADSKHEGLNMLEELAWIDLFIESGIYVPNNGGRYFAELVNPVPRALWKNKPTIGLDYAVARGQSVVGLNGEVTATISTGMIGQGVVNFGRFFGPAAAAGLMALWVALLARQDLLGADPGRLILFGSGMVLTFNMGRDITFLVLYPFLFGLAMLLGWRYFQRGRATGPGRSGQRSSRVRPSRKKKWV